MTSIIEILDIERSFWGMRPNKLTIAMTHYISLGSKFSRKIESTFFFLTIWASKKRKVPMDLISTPRNHLMHRRIFETSHSEKLTKLNL